jgi:hypothetical protein
MDVGFAWGTTLVELTGNAAADADIAELVTVDNDFFEVRARRRSASAETMAVTAATSCTAWPRRDRQSGIELGGVSQTIAGGDPTTGPGSDSYRNGTTRLADVHVVTGNSFNVKAPDAGGHASPARGWRTISSCSAPSATAMLMATTRS